MAVKVTVYDCVTLAQEKLQRALLLTLRSGTVYQRER